MVAAALPTSSAADGRADKSVPEPMGGDGKGVFVRLELPWITLAQGEIITHRYYLENASDKAIPVAIVRLEWGLAVPVGGQAFLSGRWPWGEKSPIECSIYDVPYRVEQAQWPPQGPLGEKIESWTELPAGHRLVWDQSRLAALNFDINAIVSLQEMKGHWLVGPGHWVSSDPVAVKVLPIPRSEWNKVFDATWSSFGLGKDVLSGIAYTVPIDNKLFLFWNQVRVAEVAPEDRIDHEIDRNGTNLKITIAGQDSSRSVYLNLDQGIVRDTPWPTGPISLLAPKPEPIPPAELEVLRQRTAESKANDGAGSLPPSPSGPARKDGPQVLDTQGSGAAIWPWIAVCAALLIALAAAVVVRTKRNRARSRL